MTQNLRGQDVWRRRSDSHAERLAILASIASLTPTEANEQADAYLGHRRWQDERYRTERGLTHHGPEDGEVAATLLRRADPSRAALWALDAGLTATLPRLADLRVPPGTSLTAAIRRRFELLDYAASLNFVRLAYHCGARWRLDPTEIVCIRSTYDGYLAEFEPAVLAAFAADPDVDIESAAVAWLTILALGDQADLPPVRLLPDHLHDAWTACVAEVVTHAHPSRHLQILAAAMRAVT